MQRSFLIIVTGLPASGKTTLARSLAERYGVPLIAKDLIKEPLLDVLGAPDAAASRRLSDASFRILAAVAAEVLQKSGACAVEGNFRSGEHEPLFHPLARDARTLAQVLCRAEEEERRERLRARQHDPHRHRGHRDLEQAAQSAGPASCDAFLDLPGERLMADAMLIERLDVVLRA
jgi:predicted kinase